MRTISLIHPSSGASCSPPLGMLLVAACLERAGFDVRVVDLQTEPYDRDVLLQHDPLCVALYTSTSTFPMAAKIIGDLRTVSSVPTVFGGPHVTFLDRDALEQIPGLDYIIRYEAEVAMVELANALQAGTSVHSVPNLTFRHDGGVVRSTLSAPLADLGELPLPARHLVNMSGYPAATGGGTMTSRGCSFACAFCASTFLHRRLLRSLPPARVVDELSLLHNHHDVRYVTFFDDLFTFDHKRTCALCKLILRTGHDLRWGCETRIDLVDRGLLQTMYDAGCRYIFFGTESGQESTLDGVNKTIAPCDAIDTVRAAQDVGIQVKTSLMIGLPGDTYDMVLQSIDYVRMMGPNYLAALMATPFPGTPLWGDLAAYGARIADFDLSHYDYAHPVMETSHLSASQIRELYMEAISYNSGQAQLATVG